MLGDMANAPSVAYSYFPNYFALLRKFPGLGIVGSIFR